MSLEALPHFNIHEAKTNLSRILERVEHGEEVVISRAGNPVAKLVPLTGKVHRTGRGPLRGKLVIVRRLGLARGQRRDCARLGLMP